MPLSDWFSIFRAGEHASSDGVTRKFSRGDLDNIIERYDPASPSPCVITHEEGVLAVRLGPGGLFEEGRGRTAGAVQARDDRAALCRAGRGRTFVQPLAEPGRDRLRGRCFLQGAVECRYGASLYHIRFVFA